MEKTQLKAEDALYGKFQPFVVVGFALCWAVTYLFAYSFIFTPLEDLTALQRDVSRMCYLGGIVVCELAIYLLYDHVKKYRFRVPLGVGSYVALLVAVALGVIGDLVGISGWARAPMMFVSGMWQGAFHILWAESALYLEERSAARSMYASVVIGAAVFVATTLIASASGVFIALLLAFLSLLCYVFTQQFSPSCKLGDRPMSRKLAKELHKSNVVLVIYGAVFGVGIYACMAPDLPVYVSYPLTGLALGTGVAVLLIVNVATERTFTFNELTTALLPVIAIVLMLLTFVEGMTRWVMYLLLLMLLTAFDTSSFCFLFHLTDRLRLSPIKSVARGRIFVQMGMFMAGTANLVFVHFLDLSQEYAFFMPVFLVVFLFIMVAASGEIHVLPGTLDAQASTARDDSGDEDLAKCKVLADDYDLSRRELDVLVLLMRGYDTNSIGEKLFVSPHTVKSHIYHIYKKMGVNSKQELLRKRDEM